MLWYEPWASPADWAIRKSGNINALVENWSNCKYNPAVLKVFINDEDFNFNKFATILRLYEESQAEPSQYKDLFLLCFDVIKGWINSNIEWKYSKMNIDEKSKYKKYDPEVYHVILQASLYLCGEPTQIIIDNYPDVSDYIRLRFVDSIIDCYKRDALEHNSQADTFVDKQYAVNAIKEIIKQIKASKINKDTIYEFEGSPFVAFAAHLLMDVHYYEYYILHLINETLDTYASREHHRIADPITKDSNMNHDMFDTLRKCVMCKDAPSDMTISLLCNDECCKRRDISDVCKATKIAINNINNSYYEKISKSCEDAIMEGIKNYDNTIVSIGMFDIDECITALEAIGYGIDIVTEAKYDYEDEPEDPDQEPDQEEPVDDDEESTSKKSATKATVKDTKRRDFDADFRKYKKNIKNVDVSLTKILSTLKGYLTGTSEARGIRKATGMDSLGQILARVFGTIAVFHVSKFLGILFVIVRLANSHKVTDRERAKLITEIKNEIETIDSQLSDGSVESAEAKQNLTRTKQNLQDALEKISTRRGKSMTEGSKQAVRDIVDRR